MVLEECSKDNTSIFKSKCDPNPLQVSHSIPKEKDDEIYNLRKELEQLKQKANTHLTIDTIPDKPQIDQEKEDLKKQVRESKQQLQLRFITFHSKNFENELRICVMSPGYYRIYFNERLEMTKIVG